jgi:hypothetical protein
LVHGAFKTSGASSLVLGAVSLGLTLGLCGPAAAHTPSLAGRAHAQAGAAQADRIAQRAGKKKSQKELRAAVIGTVTAQTGVNIRQDATSDSPSLGSFPYGTSIALLCQEAGQSVDGNIWWYKLASQSGWVTARYVSAPVVPQCEDIPGPPGPTGPAGPTGATGPSGGPTGATGATGPIGPQGVAGPTGPQGVQGIQGVQGPIGPTGPQGVQGVQGIQGDSGPTGATGPAGLNGTTGPTGPAGLNGTTGPTGPAGLNGLNGTNGATGPTGPAGLNGLNGADGATGPTGPAGLNGTNGATGPTGPAGLNGTTGPTGPAGLNGANGTNGATGPTGPAGPTGAAGAQVLSSSVQTLSGLSSGTFAGPLCPAGTTAVWGGVTQTAGTGPLQAQSSTGGVAWTVTVVNAGADTASFTVQSVCQ